MSGHSKWSTIKRKKGAADAARGKVFTRLIRELIIAARDGGGDPNGNARLRTAIAAAKAANMPNDNIDRAIKKGTGELDDGTVVEEIVYEGYGPFGVAVLVEVATDNRNRTVAEIRHLFTKHGGNLGETGSVAWMFDVKGVITVPRGAAGEDAVLEAALESGAEDMRADDPESFRILTGPKELSSVLSGLEERGVTVAESGLDRLPKSTKELDEAEAEKFLKFYEAIEEHDDIQKVFANFEISDHIMEKLTG